MLHWPAAFSENTLVIHSLISFSHSLKAKPVLYCNNRNKLNYPRTHTATVYTETTSIYLFPRRFGSRRERKLTRHESWEEMLWCKHIIMLSTLRNNHSASESHLSHSHCHFRLPNIPLTNYKPIDKLETKTLQFHVQELDCRPT